MSRSSLGRASTFVAASAALFACVDLFHATDFDTLCTASPTDPACQRQTEADAATRPDAATRADARDAAPERVDFCAWNRQAALDHAVRACAWLGACEGPLGESAFGPCVVRAQLAFNCAATPTLRPVGAAAAFWRCLATVSSCADVDRCVFPDAVQQCIAVNGGVSDVCGTNGNAGLRIRCSGPAGRATAIEPCIMMGKACIADGPSLAQCGGPKGFSCVASGCAGTAAVDCSSDAQFTVDRGVDCAGYGAGACAASDAGATCTPGRDAGTCSDDSPPACDRSTAKMCANGKETRVDCAELGLTCDVSEPVAAYDLASACVNRNASACNEPDSCARGATIGSCARGARFSVSCAAVGLGACRLNAEGRAACTAPGR